MRIPTEEDEESREEDSPDLTVRYADDSPRPVRERVFHGFEPRRDRSDRQLQWGPVLAAAAAGFLISIFFGPCRSTDPRKDELATLQAELQSAQDRAAQLEAELSAARGDASEADAPERPVSEPEPKASEPEPKAAAVPEAPAPEPPAPKRKERELTPEEVLRREAPTAQPVAAKETESPVAANPSPSPNPSPEPSVEPDRVALAESQGAVSVYEVPDRSAEIVRSTSRPEKPGGAVLQVLAPEQAGWTAEAQPTLYWHASEGMVSPGEFTLTREGAEEPVFRGRFPAPDPGIQRIELSEFDISLDEGASYRWKVEFSDGGAAATGGIRRVARPERAITGAAPLTERLDALERAGLWYDALDLVIRSIENNSGAKNLLTRRTAMLAKVGIHLSSS